MKERICVTTATRAEYGLLHRVIIGLLDKGYDVRVAVSGMHLSSDFGYTVEEIEKDGIKIDARIDTLCQEDTAAGISKTMAITLEKFAVYFEKIKPTLLIVLGDRYETMAVCIAAMNAGIPIVHLYGGETTEGAVDEYIRHAISKMSYLHFTSCESYRRRIIQMGESPDRVFYVGRLGAENIIYMKYMSKKKLFSELGLTFSEKQDYAVVTFHPVTLEKETTEKQIDELFAALNRFPNMNFIITKANADEGGRKINSKFKEYIEKKNNMALFDSLGAERYLNALKYARMVIGNSSSGILEAPYFNIPTINIGDRQKGRIQASSVINCTAEREEIVKAIYKGMTKKYLSLGYKKEILYEDRHTSDKIIQVISLFLTEGKIDLKKTFYNLKNVPEAEFSIHHNDKSVKE